MHGDDNVNVCAEISFEFDQQIEYVCRLEAPNSKISMHKVTAKLSAVIFNE